MHQLAVVGLSGFAERVLRDKLRLQAPSEPWVDAQIVEVTEREGDALIVRRRHDPGVFPPGGAQTAMVRCGECGIHNPPNAMEAGNYFDHREEGAWGPSPSAVAIRQAGYYFLRFQKIRLKSEKIEVLQRKIDRYLQRQAKKAAG